MDYRTITTKQYSLAWMSQHHSLLAILSSRIKVYTYPEMIETAEFSDLKYPTRACFSSDDKRLAVKNTLGTICIFDLQEKTLVAKVRQMNSAGDGSNILFTPDNLFILDGDWNGNIRLIDTQNGSTHFLERNDNFMIKSIELDERLTVFHVQMAFRWNVSSPSIPSYTVISTWRYDAVNKVITRIGITNKIMSHDSKISYNPVFEQYVTVPSRGHSREKEIVIYDRQIQNVLCRKQINRNLLEIINDCLVRVC
jgi:WD40 repeat protein